MEESRRSSLTLPSANSGNEGNQLNWNAYTGVIPSQIDLWNSLPTPESCYTGTEFEQQVQTPLQTPLALPCVMETGVDTGTSEYPAFLQVSAISIDNQYLGHPTVLSDCYNVDHPDISHGLFDLNQNSGTHGPSSQSSQA